MDAKPFDALNSSKSKRIIVELKNNKHYVGILKAFDPHINVVLDDAEERIDGEVKRKLGTVFIRGDTITIISTSK
jgi:small nuclear ribonucleoprotein